MNDFSEGLATGVFVGLLVGTTWEKSFELFQQAYSERKTMIRTRVRLSPVSLILIIVAIECIVLGTFQIVAYTRMTNFIQCQAEYNQQTAIARDARIDPTNAENEALYGWLDTLPPLLSGEEAGPEEMKNFREKLDQALQAHRVRLKVQKDNPYPDPPDETCGDY